MRIISTKELQMQILRTVLMVGLLSSANHNSLILSRIQMRRMLVARPSHRNLILSKRIRRPKSALNTYVGYDPCRLLRFEEQHAASLFNSLGNHEITNPTTWCLEGHASHHLPTHLHRYAHQIRVFVQGSWGTCKRNESNCLAQLGRVGRHAILTKAPPARVCGLTKKSRYQ